MYALLWGGSFLDWGGSREASRLNAALGRLPSLDWGLMDVRAALGLLLFRLGLDGCGLDLFVLA
jgi:hypothetical protein